MMKMLKTIGNFLKKPKSGEISDPDQKNNCEIHGRESGKLLNRVEIMKQINEHRQFQDEKFDWTGMTFADQICVLVEEVGEVARVANELLLKMTKGSTWKEYKKQCDIDRRSELIQVAAVAIRMIEDLDRTEEKSDDLINDR